MKTYEERYQAWLEDRLTPAEAEAFEKELETRPLSREQQAELEVGLPKLAEALQTHAPAPPLRNQDFFNQRIREEIADDTAATAAAQARARTAGEPQGAGWLAPVFELLRGRRLATASAAFAAIFLAAVIVMTQFTGPTGSPQVAVSSTPGSPETGQAVSGAQDQGQEYFVQFSNVNARNQNISATPVETGGAQVLWLNGLDWIEDSQKVVERIENI